MEELFLSLDANLKFKTELVEQNIVGEQAEEKRNLVDLRGVPCPLNFVKAKLELEKIEVGEVLDVLLDEGESVRNVPASFTEQGHDVVDIKDHASHFCVKIRRK